MGHSGGCRRERELKVGQLGVCQEIVSQRKRNANQSNPFTPVSPSHRLLSNFFLVSNYPKISLKTQASKGEDSRIGR